MTETYKVNVGINVLDGSAKKELKDVGALITELENGVVIEFEKGNSAKFYEQIKAAYDKVPALGLKFKYEGIKEAKALAEAELAELTTKINIDKEALTKDFNNAKSNFVTSNIKEAGGKGFALTAKKGITAAFDANANGSADKLANTLSAIEQYAELNEAAAEFAKGATFQRYLSAMRESKNYATYKADLPERTKADEKKKIIAEADVELPKIAEEYKKKTGKDITSSDGIGTGSGNGNGNGSVGIDTIEADEKLDALKKKIDELIGEEKNITINADTTKADGSLDKLKSTVDTLTEEKKIGLTVDAEAISQQIDELTAKLNSLNNGRKPEYDFNNAPTIISASELVGDSDNHNVESKTIAKVGTSGNIVGLDRSKLNPTMADAFYTELKEVTISNSNAAIASTGEIVNALSDVLEEHIAKTGATGINKDKLLSRISKGLPKTKELRNSQNADEAVSAVEQYLTKVLKAEFADDSLKEIIPSVKNKAEQIITSKGYGMLTDELDKILNDSSYAKDANNPVGFVLRKGEQDASEQLKDSASTPLEFSVNAEKLRKDIQTALNQPPIELDINPNLEHLKEAISKGIGGDGASSGSPEPPLGKSSNNGGKEKKPSSQESKRKSSTSANQNAKALDKLNDKVVKLEAIQSGRYTESTKESAKALLQDIERVKALDVIDPNAASEIENVDKKVKQLIKDSKQATNKLADPDKIANLQQSVTKDKRKYYGKGLSDDDLKGYDKISGKLVGEVTVQRYQQLKDELKDVRAEATKTADALAEVNAKAELKELTGQEPVLNGNGDSYQAQLSEYKKEIDKSKAKVEQSLERATRRAEALRPNGYLNGIDDEIRSVQERIKAINQEKLNLTDPNDIKRVQELVKAVDEVYDKTRSDENIPANPTKKAQLTGNIAKFVKRYDGLSTETQGTLSQMSDELSISGLSVKRLKELTTQFELLKAETIKSGEASQSFFGLIQERLKGINAQFLAQYFSIQDYIRYIKAAADNVVALDTALSELRKVSDTSVARLSKSFEKSAETAKELGNTVSSVINMTADWSRLGYSVDDAEELARITTLFKNVADGIDTDEASSYLISTLKGFELDTSDAEHIVDVYNELGNKYAIDSGGVGEALQRSAASLHAANTSFEQSAALVTATNEIVQDPDAVGNMWKTVSARMRGAESELTEMGEDTEGLVTSTSKLQSKIKALTGFDIMLDKDTFKDIYTIVSGIGEVWNDLTDIQRADVLETLAGKQQSNRLAAVFSNVEQLKAAYASAMNADGSAEKEQANWANSIQYSVDRAKASLEELSFDVLDSSTVKDAVDMFNELVNCVDKLIEKGNLLTPIFAAFMAKNTLDEVGGLKGIATSIDKNGFSLVTNRDSLLKQQSDLQSKLEAIEKSGKNGLYVVTEEADKLTAKLADVNEQLEKTPSALTAIGKIGFNLGVTLIAESIFNIINGCIVAEKELKETASSAMDVYNDSFTTAQNALTEIESQYKVLRNSNSSYEEQLDARQRLFDIQSQLVGIFGDDATAINLLTGNVEDLNDALEKLKNININGNAWEAAKKEANSRDYGLLGNLGAAIERFELQADSEAERILKTYSNAKGSIRFNLNDENANEFSKQVTKLFNEKGWSTFGSEKGKFFLGGTADEVAQAYDKIAQIANSLGMTDVTESIEKQRKGVDELVDDYRDFYKAYILDADVYSQGSDSPVGEMASDLSRLESEYETAIVNADKDAQEKIKKDSLELIDDDAFTGLKPAVQQALLELYPTLKTAIEAWEFEVNFKLADGAQINENEFARHMRAFGSSSELEAALNADDVSGLSPTQQRTVKYIKGQGITIEQAVSAATEHGYLKTDVALDGEKYLKELAPAEDASQQIIEDYNTLDDIFGKLSDEEKEAFNECTKGAKNSTEALNKWKASIDAASEGLSSLNVVDKLTDMDDGFSKLATIYEDVKDGGTFDYSSLSTSSLSGLGDASEIEAFVEAITAAPNNIAAAQSAFNDLATAYITAKIGSENLTEANEGLIASYLGEQGVTNADVIAQQLVAGATAEATYQKQLAINANDKQKATSALLAEAQELEAQGATDTANAYYRLYIEKALANFSFLTNDDITNLASLCTELGIATTAWQTYWAAKANSIVIGNGVTKGNTSENGVTRGSDEEYVNPRAAAYFATKESKEEVEKGNTPIAPTGSKFTPHSTSSGNAGGDTSNTDKEKDETEKFVDFYERRIDVLEKYHDKLDDVASDETESYAERSAAIKSMVAQDAETITTMQAQLTSLDNTFKGKIEELKKLADENGNITFQQYDEEGNLKDTVLTMAEFVELVKSGGLKSGQFVGDVADAVDEVITAYDEWYDATEKLDDKQKEAAEHRKEELDLELERLDAIQSVLEAEASISEGQIDLAEATGKLVTAGMYNDLIQNADDQIDILQEKISSYESYLDSLEDSDSSEYYETLAALESCNEEILQLTVNQAEWNEKIKDIPINLLDQYLQRLKAIQGLVENFISIQTAYGKATTSDQYSELFKTAGDNIEYAIKQQNLLKDKLSGYEWGSDKYNETAEQIESINDDLSSILEQMVEWNKEILEIPINKLNSVNDQLELVITAMEDIESEYEQVISAVTDSIDKQIDDINEEQEAYDDAVQDRIDKIQELIDALQAEQEARQKLLDVEDAQYDLEEARTQKSVAVIKNGSITYETDQEAEREAQQQLDEAEFEYRIYQLQQQIEQLEKEKEDKDEAYQNEIDNLEKISNKWSEIASNIELAKNQLKATEYLGEGWLNKVLTGDDAEIYYQFKTLYETMDADLTQYQQQVDSNQRIATLMEQFVTQYESGAITYEQCLNGINTLVNSLTGGLGVNETLDSYKELFSGSSMTALSDVLTKLQGSAQTEADNFSKYLSLYKSNEEVISKYTSSWEELKKSVDEQIAALKAAYEAALAAATAMKSYATSSHHSSGNGSSGGGGSSGGYTIAGANYEVVNGKVHYIQGSGVTAAEAAASTGAIEGSGRTYHVSSGTTTTSSKASSSSSSGGVIRDSNAKKYTRHNGVEGGLVGHASSDEKFDIIKKMSLTPLKDNEVPMLLKDGEAVLTQNQQSMLLSNMRTLRNLPTNSSLGGVNVNLSMSNLTFNEINNGQDFANFITKNLSNAISQSMAK